MTGLVTLIEWLVAIVHQCLWELLRDWRFANEQVPVPV
jgi:hypothetical protein